MCTKYSDTGSMKTSAKATYLFSIAFLFSLLAYFPHVRAAEFDALVVPSLMDSDLDGWYKIPPNSGPNIHKASRVYRGQMFNLLMFFRGYSADKDNNLHVRYDVQVYDPLGKPTEDKGADILAYQGPMGNPEALLLNHEYLKIVFTDKYPPGTYTIKVTAYDKISNRSFISTTPIELLPFSLPEPFKTDQEVDKWMMGYYLNPTPVKAISAVQKLIRTDQPWINDHLNILTFFRRIFSDNPFVLKNIATRFNTLSAEDQRKFLLIAAISNSKVFEPVIAADGKQELQQFYTRAKKVTFPDVEGDIRSPAQLDILWSEFLTTGRYDPVRRLVSALALKKYRGTLEKIKSGNMAVTKELQQEAYLDATYQAAIWSLVSNSKQMPLVFKYCAFMYKNEKLDEDIKNQLGSILRIVQKELQKESDTKQPGS